MTTAASHKKAAGASPPTAQTNAPGQDGRRTEVRTFDHQSDPITSDGSMQDLPLSHWMARTALASYASTLYVRDIPAALGVEGAGKPLTDDVLNEFQGTYDDACAALESFAARRKAERRAAETAYDFAAEKPLTDKEYLALYVARQDSVRAPGYYTMPQLASGVAVQTLNRLVRRGLLDKYSTTTPPARLTGRHKKSRKKHYYRVTDRACRVLTPQLPPVVVAPHLVRRLSEAERRHLRAMLGRPCRIPYDSYCESSSRRVFVAGDRVTVAHMWAPEDQAHVHHSAATLLANLVAFIRLNVPRAVIVGVRIHERRPKRIPVCREAVLPPGAIPPSPISPNTHHVIHFCRRHAWVLITFYVAGEPVPLLPAPPPVPLLPASTQQTMPAQQAAPQPVADWPLALCPADDNEHAAVWRGLSEEARAALLALYQAHLAHEADHNKDRWQRLDGVSETARRALDLQLLVFRTQGREFRISARGIDLVEAVRAGQPAAPAEVAS